MGELSLRRAGPDDLAAVIRHVQAGFDFYASFAPPGWTPPHVADEADRMRALLADAATWALLAADRSGTAGHVAFFPGREPAASDRAPDWRSRPLIPGLAHLWQLFVLEPWWGSGLAATLHDGATAAMVDRGFARARLYTPTEHARARRFYEHRGWTAQREAFHEGLGLMLTEYALVLEQ